MPRSNLGPRLVLYGPDKRHGAIPKRGFKAYAYYVVWSEHGRKQERATGTADRRVAQEKLREVLETLSVSATDRSDDVGPRPARDVTIAEVLDRYGQDCGPTRRDPRRIGIAIERLLSFWGTHTVSEITDASCKIYEDKRREAFAREETARIQQIVAKGQKPKPARVLKPATVRRELGVLTAAVNYAVTKQMVVRPAKPTLPPKSPPRQVHLTRSQVARLLRAARALPRARLHLPLFILLAFYTGARRSAILDLRWQPHDAGGHVDFQQRIIDFQGSAPVTKKRRARIMIPDRLLRFLRYARQRNQTAVIEYEGRPVREVKSALRTAGHNAGLGDVYAHMLKHSAITHLLDLGVSRWDVSQWTATSMQTLESVYGHHSPEAQERVRAALR